MLLAIFVAAVVATVLAVRLPSIPLQAVQGWRSVYKTATVWLAALAGFMGTLPTMAGELRDLLTELASVQDADMIDSFVKSQAYRQIVALLTLYIIVARHVQAPPKA